MLGGEILERQRRNSLVALRKQRGWKQKDVVEELNRLFGIKITVSYYGMIEQGVRNPNLELALAIAKLFEEDAEALFLNAGNNKMLGDSKAITTA